MSRRTKPSRPRSAANGGKVQKVRDVFVARPFAGLRDEPEWVALRELVPAATASLTLAPEYAEAHGERDITLATVLPMALPAITRQDGRVLIGLQRHQQSGDVSRDLADALLRALETVPGETVRLPSLPGPGPRLQDVLSDQPLTPNLHAGFEFWLDGQASADPAARSSLERANASIYPTARLSAAPAAYWTHGPDRAHVRLVLPDDEDPALDTLARLAAGNDLRLGEETRFAGMFRAHGLLVPVWEVPPDPAASVWEEPLAAFMARFDGARSQRGPLDGPERRARQGLLGRQLTLR